MGIAGAVVDVVRSQAITRGVDVAATVSAPSGWHRVVVTGRQSGHVVLSVRYPSLTTSRRHNLDDALAKRGWDLDEDNEGATHRIPPGGGDAGRRAGRRAADHGGGRLRRCGPAGLT